MSRVRGGTEALAHAKDGAPPHEHRAFHLPTLPPPPPFSSPPAPHCAAPFRQVLSGTKYGVKQTRGKFGLGAKMALIWSKMTTGLPFEIYSATTKASASRSHFILDIDIHK